jgi:hypothetical protein
MYGNTGYATHADYDHARYLRLLEARLSHQAPHLISVRTSEEAAYIAGIIDGEGALYVGAIGPKPHKTVYPIIRILMTDQATIEWIAKRTGAKATMHRENTPDHPSYRNTWTVQFTGTKARLLCERLRPYLVTKKTQAELFCQFPCDARSAPGHFLPEEINDIRFSLRDRINALNLSGWRVKSGRPYVTQPAPHT